MEYLGILPSASPRTRRSVKGSSTSRPQRESNSSHSTSTWGGHNNNYHHKKSSHRPVSSVDVDHQLLSLSPNNKQLQRQRAQQQQQHQPSGREPPPKAIRASVKTLGFGSTTSSGIQVKVNMDSSLALTSSLNDPNSCSFSLGSTASEEDSLALALEDFSSDENEEEVNITHHRKEQSKHRSNQKDTRRNVFVGIDGYTDESQSEFDFDPYIGSRRHPRHAPKQHQPQPREQQERWRPPQPPSRRQRPKRRSNPKFMNTRKNDSMEDFMTAKDYASDSTSTETASPPSSTSDGGAEESTTPSWSLSLPMSLQLSQIMTIPRIRVSVTADETTPPVKPIQRQQTSTTVVAAPPAAKAAPAPPTTSPKPSASPEQIYWNRIVTGRTTMIEGGESRASAAEAFMHLGHAYMRAKDYPKALVAFRSAHGIWKALHGPNHLSVASASDAVGMALLRSQKNNSNLQLAKLSLESAFTIRYHLLGPWHVDTVDSYNKIAGAHLHLREFQEACTCYEQVFLVRRAIFGSGHPSVAISAHSLANVHFHLSSTKESLRYYNIALEIYTRMQLKSDHPTVSRLLRDRKRLERVMMAELCVRLEAAEVDVTNAVYHPQDDADEYDDDYCTEGGTIL